MGARRRVADRVLHQVEGHPVQLVGRAVDHGGPGVDRQVVRLGHRAELGGGVHEDPAQVGRLARQRAARVGAGQQQQVADQPPHALRRAQGRARGLGALAVEHLGQQLEVGQDAGQRRAQLVRGVGDEVALADEQLLGLAARALERVEHLLQRVPELGHLVVGHRLRQRAARVARLGDVARAGGQRGDGRHRAPADDQAAEQGQQRAREDAAAEEQPDARDGVLDDRDGAAVLDDQRHDEAAAADVDPAPARLDLISRAVCAVRGSRMPKLGAPVGLGQDRPSRWIDADDGVVGGRVDVDVRAVEVDVAREAVAAEGVAVGQVVDGGGELVVEVRAHARRGHLPDDHRERGEDDQRQRRRRPAPGASGSGCGQARRT